jgi:hypothetical protein
VRTWLPWRTIETEHFVFHYPADLEAFTRSLASHADAIDARVSHIVGFSPPHKTHVVVDDPYATSNGSAWTFVNQPVISAWASPPDPREDIGEYRGWGPTLLSHEFAHVAHLSRPSRDPLLRNLWRFAPVDLSPMTLNSPRWVFEGYATYVEGLVTGSGRPHGAWRPALLREWALEGQLPRYEQLNNYNSFEGGEFAYLAGSAFLEWLAARGGDSSLVAVWRRMTARQPRTFDEAFTGVYGESARTLYGRFTTELTGKSIAIQRALRAAYPADTGAIVQRLAWNTGDPAVSADGRRVAIQITSPTQPSRIVIWSTASEPDTGRARRDSVLRARDPEDVPARSIFPPPKRVLASLRATSGAPYEDPRFLNDGRVLLSRQMQVGDGSRRPDLFIWNPQERKVHRVTRNASLRLADPHPKGRSAVAIQCLHGWCDLALVDLMTGTSRVIARGNPDSSYYRPRFSPDGSRIVASVNSGGEWRAILLDTTGAILSTLPAPGNAYDAAWLGNSYIVLTSDADGIPNLELVDINNRTYGRLTSVSGAAVAAEGVARDSSVWFLSLYSRGYDLRRVIPRPRRDSLDIAVDSSLSPAARILPVDVAPLPENPVSPPRSFGPGPRLFRWLPLPEADADGLSAILALSSSDVLGRSDLTIKLAAGDLSTWRGVVLDATWRGFRPFARVELFDVAQSLSHSRSRVARPAPIDESMKGALALVDGSRSYESWSARYRLATSAARLGRASDSRTLMIGDGGLGTLQRFGTNILTQSVAGSVTLGNTASSRFYRAVLSGGMNESGFTPMPVSLSATYARTSTDAPAFEQLSLGGSPSTLVDRVLLTQRLAMPALPSGIALGSSALTYRATLGTEPLALYFWSGSASATNSFSAWHRVIGGEAGISVPAIPYAGVPSARIVYGLGESLDAPFRKQWRAYLNVIVNP